MSSKQQDKMYAVQQPALYSDLAITNDQSQNSENIDDVDEFEETVNEESFAEEMERIELTQISNESQFETANAPIAVPLIEEVRKYPCIWNIASSSHKDKPKKMEAWRRIAAVLNQKGEVLDKIIDLRFQYARTRYILQQ